jgi:hypothetical protein
MIITLWHSSCMVISTPLPQMHDVCSRGSATASKLKLLLCI